MLDDLKYIHEKDAQDALGIAEKQWQQLEHVFEISHWQQPNKISNIVYAGMGGSALAGLISTSWPGYSVPFEVSRQYDVPSYVGPETLFIAASYSGNTEETLQSAKEAKNKGATIVVIAGGGKLKELAENESYPFALLPKASQPRYAVLYNLKALVTILEKSEILEGEEVETVLHEAGKFLQKSIQVWLPTVPVAQNPAKKLANELAGKSGVVYSGPLLSPAAYKWKISFNENAKNVAWWGTLPEFNHNEFLGWTSHPVNKPYGIIELRSNLEHPRVQKRFEVSERLLSGMRPSPYVVEVEGDNLLEQLVWSIAFGDFVTIYLGLLNGVNPTPIDLIEKFKKALNE